MEPLAVETIAHVAGGHVAGGNPGTLVRGVSTDSRTLRPGDLFVPLAGERFDGHDFIADALGRGAAATLIRQGRPLPQAGEAAVVLVDDPLLALHRLAAWYRARLGARVVAVTGSNGKTTTKDMVAAILTRRWSVAKSQGNYNNEVGLPLAILSAPRGTGVLVLEMAMRGPGQIRQLAAVARPEIGIVTNVGPVHMELLGSMDAIAAAKAELVEALPGTGWAVLNADDPRVRAMARRTPARSLLYGLEPGLELWASDVTSRGLEGSEFTVHWRGERARVALPAPGRHNVYNALAAAGAGLALGMRLDEVVQGLLAVAGHVSGMRLEIHRRADGVQVINDAYNASPASMASALELLAEARGERRVAILGDMLELGPVAEEAHQDLGRRAAAARVDLLAYVGQWAPTVLAAAAAAGMPPERAVALPDAAAAAEWAMGAVRPGDIVLVKASRGLRLEQVAARLLRAEGGERA